MDLNNRELATLFWLLLIAIVLITFRKTRAFVPILFKTAFHPKLTIIYVVMATYTVTIAYILYRLELWDNNQFKSVVLWFLTVGLISLKDVVNEKQTSLFRNTVLKIFSLTAILQFIIGVYSFSFVIELMLIPIIFLIVAMISVADKNPSHISVKNLLNGTLAILGAYTIGFTIYKIIVDFNSFANRGTFNDFLIPSILSFTFIPLVYFLSIVAARETVFISLGNILSIRLLWLAKLYTLWYFPFNKESLQRWKNSIFLKGIKNETELLHSIKNIKKLRRIEKNPPPVPIERGWCPYKAKAVLAREQITSTPYQNTFKEEWSCSAIYVEGNDYSNLNSIAYYVVGNAHAAKTIELVMNIGEPTTVNNLRQKMIDCAEILYQFAMGHNAPEAFTSSLLKGRGFELKFGNRCVSIYKEYWPNHKLNGYGLILRFKIIPVNE